MRLSLKQASNTTLWHWSTTLNGTHLKPVDNAQTGKKCTFEEGLVSSFLEGLIKKFLYESLYTKKHDNLDTWIKAAIDLDDNCDIYQDKTFESGASSQSARLVANDLVPRVESPPSNAMPTTY